MGIFLRKLWQNKPKQWGPFSVVQSALFHNLERIGIDPQSCKLAMCFWNPGDQIDYAIADSYTNTGGVFNKNSINLNTVDNDRYIDTGKEYSNLANKYTIIYKAEMLIGSSFFWGAYSAANNDYDYGLYRSTTSGYSYYPTSGVAVSFDNNTFGDKTFCVTADGTNVKTYLDGQYKNSVVNNVSLGANYNLVLGKRWRRTNYYFNHNADQSIIFNIPIAASLIALLNENPWQLWQPRAATFYSFSDAASPTLLPIMMNMNQFNGGIYETD